MTTHLINTYSSRNLGDAAILKSLAELSSDSDMRANLHENKPLPVPGVSFNSPNSEGHGLSLEKNEHRISVGGDIFNNARPYLITRRFLDNIDQLKQAPKATMLFGQTIPSSCKGFSRWYLANTLKSLAAVVVRDEQSYDMLRRLGVKASLSYDTAFALRAEKSGERRARKIFEKSGLEPQETVLLSVRNFNQMYLHDQREFEQKMAKLAALLLERSYSVAVLIQSDATSQDSDIEVAKHIQKQVPDLKILNAIDEKERDDDPVSTLIGILNQAHIVVALRYHAAILRLVSGRMPYHISYSRKGEDLNSRLELPGCNLNTFDPEENLEVILSTANMSFDHESIRQHVQTSFQQAQHKLEYGSRCHTSDLKHSSEKA